MKTIKQTVHINAKPTKVYDAYVDAEKHAEFIDDNVKFENKVGGKFDVWDGYATGENVQLIPGKKIVQKWRASDWPQGHYSDLTIDLEADGEGTKLTLVQENVPDDKADEVDKGWHEYYWDAMNKYFGKQKS